MNNPVNKLIVIAAAMLVLFASPMLRAQPSDLLAHGADDVYWVAQVVANNDSKQRREETIIRARGIGSGQSRWVEVTRLNARVINLAARGSDLVALLEPRDWLILWGTGQMTGPSIGGGSVIQTIASDRDSIWCIAIQGSPPTTTAANASTNPATEPSTTAASMPTRAPSISNPSSTQMTEPGELALYKLERGTWVWKSTLPSDARTDQSANVGMTVLSGSPLIGVADIDGSIHTYQYGNDGQWTNRGVVTPAQKGPFKLVATGQAVLWEGGTGGAGSIRVLGEKWSEPMPLKVSAEVRQPEARTIASVGGNLRFLFLDNGKIFEQVFDATGKSLGNAAELPMPSGATNQYNLPMIALVMALLVALAIAVLRRGVPGKKPE
jgi:hypothetical protein